MRNSARYGRGNELEMKERIKYGAKRSLAGLTSLKRQSAEKDILLLSTRRSGTTMLMETILSQRGMNYVDQPTDLWKYHPRKNLLPNTSFSRFISLDGEEEKMMFDFFHSVVFAGKLKGHMQWRFWDRSFSFFYDRVIVKELGSKALIEWFAKNFNVHIVYLVRHPLAVAESIKRKAWGTFPEAFLENEWFRETYLDNGLLRRCHEILSAGNQLEKMILEWCLENLHPLKQWGTSEWLALTFEELVMRPDEMVGLLSNHLHLPDQERAYQRLIEPSMTTTRSSRKAMQECGNTYVLNKWQESIDPGTEERLMTIVRDFDIDIYREGSSLPVNWACHFGALEL